MLFLSRFLARRRTIESITSPITNIVSQLKEHAAVHSELVSAHSAEVVFHQTSAELALAETHRANEQADKFAKLVA